MNIKTITVSVKDAAAYMENTNALFKALWELTDMIKEESELKKHHRAYLHVRENIDEKVKEARVLMSKVCMDTLKSSFEGNMPEKTEDCDDPACLDRDRDCQSCAATSYHDEGETEYPFEEVEDDEHTIILSKRKYEEMVEDLLTMAELIDMVCDMRTHDEREIRKLSRFVPSFAAYERNRLSLYHEAAKDAESIMDRWDDEYEPDEYFSD